MKLANFLETCDLLITTIPSSLDKIFSNIKKKIKNIELQSIKIKVLIVRFLLSSKYSLSKKNYLLIGSIDGSFYYWLKYSGFKFRTFQTKRTRFMHKKFLFFYFIPSVFFLQKRGLLRQILQIKKKISLLKKTNTLKKWVLFRCGSRSWKNNIFTKPHWESVNKVILSSKKIARKPFNTFIENFTTYIGNEIETANEFNHKEINIKSRFNRVFYENRKIFSFLFNRKNLRQKKFNQYYSNWLKKDYFDIILTFESSLKNILLRSKFAFTEAHCDFLLANKLVFVNGVVVMSKNFVMKTGDRIQLIISQYYYFYYRQVLSDMIYLKKSLNLRVWKMVRFNDNIHKQSATHVPTWILLLSYYFLDVPRYIEVDYTVLTSILIYEPIHLHDFNSVAKNFLNLFLMRLYNWRYIV